MTRPLLSILALEPSADGTLTEGMPQMYDSLVLQNCPVWEFERVAVRVPGQGAEAEAPAGSGAEAPAETPAETQGASVEGTLAGTLAEAAARTTGHYLALVEPWDHLEPGALSALLLMLHELGAVTAEGKLAADGEASSSGQGGPALIYTDEIWQNDTDSVFVRKPEPSLRALRQYDLLGRLTLIRRDVFEAALAVPAVEDAWSPAWEWDLHLRAWEAAAERGAPVLHLPVVACWRPTPPAADALTLEAGARAVRAHLDRSGVRATVEVAGEGVREGAARDAAEGAGVAAGTGASVAIASVRVTPEVPELAASTTASAGEGAGAGAEAPLVSIVIPTGGGRQLVDGRDALLVADCVASIVDRTDLPEYEIILVTSEGTDPRVIESVAKVVERAGAPAPLVTVHADGEFNFSRSCNLGVAAARGRFVLLLNDDTLVLTPQWLRLLVAIASDDSAGRVGAVGAKLLFPDGTVQHGGVHSNPAGDVGHTQFGEPDWPGQRGEYAVDQDVLGVTGACLLVRRDRYEEVGGLSEMLPVNYNDVDLCLKLRAAGYTNVYTPRVALIHRESATRTVEFTQDERAVLEWWLPWSRNDPNVQLFGVH